MQNPESLEWYRFARMDLSAADTLNEYARPRPLEIICIGIIGAIDWSKHIPV
jgi:hypothetical protein